MLQKISIPLSQPQSSPHDVDQLQAFLVSYAESLLGPRQPWRILHPEYFPSRPYLLVNTPANEIQAHLTCPAGDQWPVLILELAHETIHMLDPKQANASYLEEGIAEIFSTDVMTLYNFSVNPPVGPFVHYTVAVDLVKKLPLPPYDAGKHIRKVFGAFHQATVSGLVNEFGISQNLAKDLLEPLT